MILRNKLIRLAHENPELRADLLPILKTASAGSISELKQISDNFSTTQKELELEATRRQEDLKRQTLSDLRKATETFYANLASALQRATKMRWHPSRLRGDLSVWSVPNLELTSSEKGADYRLSYYRGDSGPGPGEWRLGVGEFGWAHKLTFKADRISDIVKNTVQGIASIEAKNPDIALPRDDRYFKDFQKFVDLVFGRIQMSDIRQMMFKYQGGRREQLKILFGDKTIILKNWGRNAIPDDLPVSSLAAWLEKHGAKKARL